MVNTFRFLRAGFRDTRSKKLLIAAAVVVAFGAMTGSAAAGPVLPDFTISQTTVSNCTLFLGTPSCTFNADKMTGNYNEVFTATGATTFSTTAYYDLGQFVTNDGATPVLTPFLDCAFNGPYPAADCYSIYATFTASGTYVPNVLGGYDFTGVTGALSVYVDLNQNTTKATPTTSPNPIILGNTGDDSLLASAPLLTGPCPNGPSCGQTTSGSAAGDFNLTFQPFTLTTTVPGGTNYFVAPVPFYLTLILKGQFNSFDPTFGGACGPPGTFGTATCSETINGSADAFFSPIRTAVPEPATLTLFGLGLVGLARFRRKV